MPLTALTAISPVDGRYRQTTEPLADYFSEQALIRYRTMVEVEYFIALCKIPLPQLSAFPNEQFESLRKIAIEFSNEDGQRVKEIEAEINHDVKAIEYFLKEAFDRIGVGDFKEFIHFGLTSQDITNTAVPLSLKAAWREVLLPLVEQLLGRLTELANEWKNVVMLARTHGQPASPTSLGKEIFVFVNRLSEQLKLIRQVPFSAKFGGATGNFNAHYAAYPQIDWIAFADRFVGDTLDLKRSAVTTQIDHYDHLGAFFDNLKRIDTILIDFCRDIWTYISFDYFKQEIKSGEVGSSTMPNKVNPIDFENAEGNFGVANAVFEHLASKLPISRMQRDLSDSTVMRNIGVPMGHLLIGLKSLQRGINKLKLNQAAIQKDLDQQWAVVAEGIQTILRREGYPKPYEALKSLTRTHSQIDRETIDHFIDDLDLPDDVKNQLRVLTPTTYTGKYNF